MGIELSMIVVDNDTKEIIGDVIDFQMDGFSMLLRQGDEHLTLSFDSIDELLKGADQFNVKIYYQLSGVRIPLNRITYENRRYLDYVGWSDLTPAEATIFGELNKEKLRVLHNGWLSAAHLEKVLKDFGFTPTSLRMLLVSLRRKLADTYYSVENKNRVGYRLLHKMHDARVAVSKHKRLANSDYAILLKDENFKYYVVESIEHYLNAYRLTGSQILLGWQGLTKSEAEIFFELVKHRGTVVSYAHLLDLPCMMRSSKERTVREKNLKNFVGKIRRKIENTGQVIHTEYRAGYCLI